MKPHLSLPCQRTFPPSYLLDITSSTYPRSQCASFFWAPLHISVTGCYSNTHHSIFFLFLLCSGIHRRLSLRPQTRNSLLYPFQQTKSCPGSSHPWGAMCRSWVPHLRFSHPCACLHSTTGSSSSSSSPALPVQDAVTRFPLRPTGFPKKHNSIYRAPLKSTQPFPTLLLPTK